MVHRGVGVSKSLEGLGATLQTGSTLIRVVRKKMEVRYP